MGHPGELGVSVTIDPHEIKSFMDGGGQRVVFSTYQSSERIVESQKLGAPEFDLIIADEAHHCTGAVESHFATVIDDNKLLGH